MRHWVAVLAGVFGALALSACTSSSSRPPAANTSGAARAASEATPPVRSLAQLKSDITTNAGGFRSLQADCTVTIQNPRLVLPEGTLSPQGVVTLAGTIEVAVPRRIRLRLSQAGKRLVDVVGNGFDYMVDMPMIQSRYKGAYDMPLVREARRVSLLPDDLSLAFDQNNIFADQSLVLKSFSDYWALEGVQLLKDPERVIIPATYWLQRIDASAQNPAMINRITRFEANGDVRCELQLRGYQPIPDNEHGVVVSIPHQVLLVYPGERTSITIQLRDVDLNPRLDPKLFDVPKGPVDGGASSVTKVKGS